GGAGEGRGAKRWGDEPEKNAQRRGLSRAIGAKKAGHEPWFHGEAEVRNGGDLAESLGQAANLYRYALSHGNHSTRRYELPEGSAFGPETAHDDAIVA